MSAGRHQRREATVEFTELSRSWNATEKLRYIKMPEHSKIKIIKMVFKEEEHNESRPGYQQAAFIS
jgi:DNA-directed RNA polymerase subunit E'/Rpb7